MELTTAMPAAATSDALSSDRRVVYLFGAGATHGAARYAGSSASLLMSGLNERLLKRMHEEYVQDFSAHPGIRHLVNDVVDAQTNFEHLLTFLEDTPSRPYKEFGERLREVFSTVLRTELDGIRRDLGPAHSALYAVLVDMHQVEGSGESLAGFLTLNYDSFLEHAIEALGRGVDYGVSIKHGAAGPDPIPVLKLHGSFSWRHNWPLEIADDDLERGLWIPPGIRKVKADYPFNAIWGLARELLDCDVLRIVGCNLGSNDWDLVSLLFSTMHGRDASGPYAIEVIGRPETAARICAEFPYLNVNSLLDIDGVGAQLIAEVLSRPPAPFSVLEESEQRTATEFANSKITNPFEHWLRVKGELMVRDLPAIETDKGVFESFVEESR